MLFILSKSSSIQIDKYMACDRFVVTDFRTFQPDGILYPPIHPVARMLLDVFFSILDIQKIVRVMHIVKYLEFGHKTMCNKEKAAPVTS